MILLSNHRSLPVKQIQVKQIERPKQPITQEESNDKLQTLQLQVKQAEAKLHEINKKIKDQQENIDEEIRTKRKQWESERATFMEEAQQQGYQQGFEQGKKDSQQQHNHLIIDAVEVLDKSNIEYKKIVAESNETVLQIAMAAAEKIMNQSLEEDRSKFIPIVSELIAQVKDHPQLKLFVSSTYYPLLLDNKDELRSIILDQVEFRIYPSSELQSDQVMIETPFGKIDASIDSQLEEIRNRLFHVMEEITRDITNNPRGNRTY